MDTTLVQIWNHLTLAARDVADAIHAQSKGLPTQELLAQADERAAQAHLSIKKHLAVREQDRITK